MVGTAMTLALVGSMAASVWAQAEGGTAESATAPVEFTGQIAVVPDAWEAYNMVNRWSLAAAHTCPRSFAGDRLVNRKDGQHLQSGSPMPSSAIRAVTVTMCCQLWASVCRQVELGLESDIDAIRMNAVTNQSRRVDYSTPSGWTWSAGRLSASRLYAVCQSR